MRDLMDVLRGVVRRPAFSLAVVATLALGIGANAAIFSLLDGVLLRPLPYRQPERLVALYSTGPDRSREPFSIPDFLDYRERTHAFDAIAAHGSWGANLTQAGEPERLQGLWASPGLLWLLGVEPELGRAPVPEEEHAGGRLVVLLSDGLWRRRFGADPSIVGRDLTLNGERYAVIGVLPPDFVLPGREADLLVPLILDTDGRRDRRGSDFMRLVARLKPGVSEAQAEADATRLARQLSVQYPDTNAAKTGVALARLHSEIVGRVRTTLAVLQAAVALLLGVACANLANLMLARLAGRAHEFGVRAALGACAADLARLVLGESLALSFFGGLLGIPVAQVALRLLLALGPVDLPRRAQVGIDGGVVGFGLALALLTGLVVGLVPAWRSTRSDPHASLRLRGRAVTGSGGVRAALVTAEVALSLVLLAGAGLLVRSLARVNAVDPGFSPGRLLTARLSLPRARYPDRATLVAFHDRLAPRLLALPGVDAVAAASVIPLMDWRATVTFEIDGQPPVREEEAPIAQYRMVSPGYFETMGIPRLTGREFDPDDAEHTLPVAVVNAGLARRFWPGRSPLGGHLSMDDAGVPARSVEVVGVVGDVKHYGLDSPSTYDIYVPIQQIPDGVAVWLANSMSWVVRTRQEPMAIAETLRREIHAVDPDVAASSVRTMDEALSSSLAARRFSLFLLETFALAGLLLAAAGTYAVTAQVVAQETRAIGVRIALGAGRRQILRLVFGRGLRPVAAGIALGLAGALLAARLGDGLLFGVSPHDPATLAAVAVVLLWAALLAIYLPGRRALRVDPILALRAE